MSVCNAPIATTPVLDCRKTRWAGRDRESEMNGRVRFRLDCLRQPKTRLWRPEIRCAEFIYSIDGVCGWTHTHYRTPFYFSHLQCEDAPGVVGASWPAHRAACACVLLTLSISDNLHNNTTVHLPLIVMKRNDPVEFSRPRQTVESDFGQKRDFGALK